MVKAILWAASAKVLLAMACVAALTADERMWSLSSAGVPILLPCLLAALWGIRGAVLGMTGSGLRLWWGLVLVLGGCYWARVPLLLCNFDWIAAARIELLLPAALWRVAAPTARRWALAGIAVSLAVAGAELAGVLPPWAFWAACASALPVILKGAPHVELPRVLSLSAAAIALALFAFLPWTPAVVFSLGAVTFSALIITACTHYPPPRRRT